MQHGPVKCPSRRFYREACYAVCFCDSYLVLCNFFSPYVELRAGSSASLIFLKIYKGCLMHEKFKLQLNYFYTEFELKKKHCWVCC